MVNDSLTLFLASREPADFLGLGHDASSLPIVVASGAESRAVVQIVAGSNAVIGGVALVLLVLPFGLA